MSASYQRKGDVRCRLRSLESFQAKEIAIRSAGGMFQPNKTLMTMAVNAYAVAFQKHNSLAGGEKEERCYQPDDD